MFELHAEPGVLNAQRHPLSIELFVTLVVLDLTPNVADTIFANLLSSASHFKCVTELIVRPCLLLRMFVLPGQGSRAHRIQVAQLRLDSVNAFFDLFESGFHPVAACFSSMVEHSNAILTCQ